MKRGKRSASDSAIYASKPGPSGKELAESLLWAQDEKTKLSRGFENTVVPGLVQTPEYARARFAKVVLVHKVPNDISEAVKQRMQRQEMLRRHRIQDAVRHRPASRLLDNELVRVETYSAELNLRQPQEIELYSRIFERHAAVAGYGTAARAIIGRVMAELAAEVPDEPGS